MYYHTKQPQRPTTKEMSRWLSCTRFSAKNGCHAPLSNAEHERLRCDNDDDYDDRANFVSYCVSLVPQEFLAEMLDALHEDVNRVIDKPYVPAPDDDEAESGRSDQDLADEAWDRHVQRNRSVIVDLFQGQLKMECRCTVCNKKVCMCAMYCVCCQQL